MNGNFYSNEQLTNIRHAERIAEADAYRRARQVEQATISKQQADKATTRPFGWIRRLALRLAGSGI